MRATVAALLAPAALSCALPCLAAGGAGDYDGDGRSDVFWRNTATGADVAWMSADASTPRAAASVASPHWMVVGEGDFDGDGRTDLFWRNDSTGANAIWRSADPSGAVAVATVANLQWRVAGVGDFDADGRDDLLWRNLATGANVAWASARATAVQGLATVGDLDWVVAGIGDFDGDGHADIFWRNARTGANAVWPSANAALRRNEPTVADPDWQVAAVGDFDGDGRSDLFWRDGGSGRDAVWYRGSAGTAAWSTSVADLAWQVAASGDYDGDGRDDLLWRNYLLGANVIWRSAAAASRRTVATVANLDWALVPYQAQPTRPLLAIAAGATTAEGDSGSHPVLLPVRLSHPSVFPVRYDVDLHDVGSCTACATAGSDYVGAALSGQMIAAGQLRGAVSATVAGDTLPEANERFAAVVHSASGARLAWEDCLVSVVNDDANTVWVDDASSTEGDSGTHPMRFAIRLSRPSSGPVAMHVATVQRPGTFSATAGVDYLGTSADVSLPAGATSATFDVAIVGDRVWEPLGESFGVVLGNVSGALPVGDLAFGYIRDDEPPIIP